MKRSRFNEEQIIAILREQEAGVRTEEVCRKHGISSATFYKWKAKYGGLEVSDARRLKALDEENRREAGRSDAGRRHAEGHRRKKMVTPVARREVATHLCQSYPVSQRRACRVIGADRTSIRYRRRRPDDAAAQARLRELAAVRRRFATGVCRSYCVARAPT